jgi:hypothetical protein
MPASQPGFSDCVFINCPFDRDYLAVFEAVTFTILDAGFVPRCALDEPDSGDARLRRIQRIIETSRYSMHDISRVELSPRFPRFNMPFELGLDLGCRRYGDAKVRRKRCLVLDSEPYRYQQVLSDIAGQDIKAHRNSANAVIKVVRDWLKAVSRRTTIPGPQAIRRRFASFCGALPRLCDEDGLDRSDLLFLDYVTLAQAWIKSAQH